MECPLCKGEIAEGAKVCKHCKARIIKCPNCLEYTDGNKDKCQVCDSTIDISSFQAEHSETTSIMDKEAAKINYLKKKKSFGISLILNLLWAGWGIYYCEAKEGRWIAGVNIIAFIMSFFTAWVPCLILFIYATIICYKQVEVYNAELELSLINNNYRPISKINGE
jgi:hypothetical protein